MDSKPQSRDLHKIVILNPKGGAGKTTLATNIASYYARRGPPPTLVDCDPQGYSLRWLRKRPDRLPKIIGVEAYDHCNPGVETPPLRAWVESRQMIVDLPAALAPEQLFDQTYDAQSILIPVVPSEVDIYSAARFIADLLLVAQHDRRERKLAIVANRTRERTRSYRMLMRFLTSLDIPVIAQLRDSQNYVHATAIGVGIHELPPHRVRKDLAQMASVIDWLDHWRMRRLDAVASADYEHSPGAEILTPSAAHHH